VSAIAALRRVPLRSLLGFAGGLAVRGLETVGKLGLYWLVGRRLGPHESGLFFLCLTWATLAATPARMGMERAMTRHIAAELAVGQGLGARRALFAGMGWSTLGSLVMAVLTALAAWPASRLVFGDPALAPPLVATGIVLVPMTFSISLGYALAGFRRGVSAQLVQNGLWPALTLAALALGITGVGPLLLALAGAYLVSCVWGIAIVLLDRGRLGQATEAGQAEALPTLWASARPFLVVEIVQVSLITLPVLVLGAASDPASVGAFSIANRASTLIWVVCISIAMVASPGFAEHHRRGERAELRRANRLMRVVTAVIGVPVALLLLLVPGLLLGLVGPDFRSGAPALAVLAFGQLVNALLPSQDVVLAMTGHGRTLRLLNLLQLATMVVLCATVIPAFGLMGAAVTQSVLIVQGAIGTAIAVARLEPGAF
jgi:O-antigen/teichoic acid export membrane protein